MMKNIYRENKELMSKVGSVRTSEETADLVRHISKLGDHGVSMYAMVSDIVFYHRKELIQAFPFELPAAQHMGDWEEYINDLVSYQTGNALQSLTKHLVVQSLDDRLSDAIFPLLNKVASDASYQEDVLKGGGLIPFLLDLPASLFKEGMVVLSESEDVKKMLSLSPTIMDRFFVCESLQVDERYFHELITYSEGSALKKCIQDKERERYEVVNALLFRVRHNPFYRKRVLEGGGLIPFLVALDIDNFVAGLTMIINNDEVNLVLEKDARIKEKMNMTVFGYKRP